MREELDEILSQIDKEIDEIDLYDFDIIKTSLSTVLRLQTILNGIRIKLQNYVFPT